MLGYLTEHEYGAVTHLTSASTPIHTLLAKHSFQTEEAGSAQEQQESKETVEEGEESPTSRPTTFSSYELVQVLTHLAVGRAELLPGAGFDGRHVREDDCCETTGDTTDYDNGAEFIFLTGNEYDLSSFSSSDIRSYIARSCSTNFGLRHHCCEAVRPSSRETASRSAC